MISNLLCVFIISSSHSDAIVLYRAPQFKNKFEPSTVVFDGSSLDELTTFVKANL